MIMLILDQCIRLRISATITPYTKVSVLQIHFFPIDPSTFWNLCLSPFQPGTWARYWVCNWHQLQSVPWSTLRLLDPSHAPVSCKLAQSMRYHLPFWYPSLFPPGFEPLSTASSFFTASNIPRVVFIKRLVFREGERKKTRTKNPQHKQIRMNIKTKN